MGPDEGRRRGRQMGDLSHAPVAGFKKTTTRAVHKLNS